MRKIRDKKVATPVRFMRDQQQWEVVYSTDEVAYAVRLNKKGSPFGIVEKFYERI